MAPVYTFYLSFFPPVSVTRSWPRRQRPVKRMDSADSWTLKSVCKSWELYNKNITNLKDRKFILLSLLYYFLGLLSDIFSSSYSSSPFKNIKSLKKKLSLFHIKLNRFAKILKNSTDATLSLKAWKKSKNGPK